MPIRRERPRHCSIGRAKPPCKSIAGSPIAISFWSPTVRLQPSNFLPRSATMSVSSPACVSMPTCSNRTRACLHSPCPQDGGDEIDDGGEAPVGLLIARGNASKGFYAAEEVFDEMPPLVFFSVTSACSWERDRKELVLFP